MYVLLSNKHKNKNYFYCCTVQFYGVKIPFYPQMNILLNMENVKIYN